MLDPAGLYEWRDRLEAVPEGMPLVAGLTGFADAGSAVSQLGSSVLGGLENEELISFDPDILLDYRARRPIIEFDGDHLTDFRAGQLKVYLVYDEVRHPFLFLTGFEPDFQWNRFSGAVLDLIDRWKVSSTTWVHAIPMPVPHTRPIGVTVSGNRPELIESMSVWRPQTTAPANAMHLIEFQLAKREHPITGFVLLVPHYLADTEYPAAAVAALQSISAATGLILPTDRLREEDREFVSTIDEQVAGNAELGRLVGALEERHDTYMQDSPIKSPLTSQDGTVPSADEIAAELENFLAVRRHGDDQANDRRE